MMLCGSGSATGWTQLGNGTSNDAASSRTILLGTSTPSNRGVTPVLSKRRSAQSSFAKSSPGAGSPRPLADTGKNTFATTLGVSEEPVRMRQTCERGLAEIEAAQTGC